MKKRLSPLSVGKSRLDRTFISYWLGIVFCSVGVRRLVEL